MCRPSIFVLCGLLIACSDDPQRPSAAQNTDLDDAAARLDQAGNDLAPVDDSGLVANRGLNASD